MSKKLKILVSILTYNGGEKTLATIGDLICQVYNSLEIEFDLIVINNCSTNDIFSRISNTFPEIRVINNNINSGFSGGNNIAVNLAIQENFDYLFVLNDDLRLKQDYIQRTIEGIKKISSPVAAIGSIIRLPDGVIQAVSGDIVWWCAAPIWRKDIKAPQVGCPRQIDMLQGAAFVLTKEAISRGFKFDENLFFGGEEYDLGHWAKRSNMKIYVLESIEVIHNTSQSNIIINRWHSDTLNYYYSIRNNIYVKKKYCDSYIELIFAIACYFGRSLVKSLIFYARGDRENIKFVVSGFVDAMLNRMGKYSK